MGLPQAPTASDPVANLACSIVKIQPHDNCGAWWPLHTAILSNFWNLIKERWPPSHVLNRPSTDDMIRNFKIIGMSSNVDTHIPEFVTKHLEPWLSSACKMRNAVMHGCVKMDFEIIRKTIRHDLPG